MVEPHDDLHKNELTARIARLEAHIEELSVKLEKVARQQVDWDKIDAEHMKLIDRDLADAFERIKNIELKYFPNLASDILRLHEIIGEGEDRAYNELDHRHHRPS
jgi:hypothetical protein